MSNALIPYEGGDLGQPLNHPTLEAKRKKLLLMIELQKRFKIVDPELIQIRSPFDSTVPAFCIHSVEAYRRKFATTLSSNGYTDASDGRVRCSELIRNAGFITSNTATPQADIPSSAMVIYDELKGLLDDCFIVWDAADKWTAAVTTGEVATTGDPLMIGVVDGVWFCLKTWDLTKLESYFVE